MIGFPLEPVAPNKVFSSPVNRIPPLAQELIFAISPVLGQGFVAECLNARIEARARDFVELEARLSDAIASHYDGRGRVPDPAAVHLLYYPE